MSYQHAIRIAGLRAPDRPLDAVLDLIRLWRERARTRRRLRELEDHLLADIGVARSEAVTEAAKPFWQE